MRFWPGALGLALIAAPATAQEQAAPEYYATAAPQDSTDLRFALEASSDERVRGLSWSEGRAALGVSARVGLASGLSAEAAAMTLRGSARHGGADGLVRLGAGYDFDLGGWRLGAGARGYLFAGGIGGLSYAELEARAGYSLGPAALRAALRYAPLQDAIGGSNLHAALDADLGVPGTPFTLYAGVGHSNGAVRDPLRAQRLRPGGSYWDWSLGGEWVSGPVVVGARYTDTSVPEAAARHAGSRLSGYVRLEF